MCATTSPAAPDVECTRSEIDFPANIAWHASAPPAVVEATAWDEGSPGWEAWQRHLSGRKKPRTLTRLLRSDELPLAWAVPAEDEWRRPLSLLADWPRGGPASAEWVERAAEALPEWLASEVPARPDAADALEAVAWCHALVPLTAHVPAELWWDALAKVISSVGAPTAGDSNPGQPDDPLAWQLLAAELPLALASCFPEIDACRRLAGCGRKGIQAGFDELLDDNGLPKFDQLPNLRLLLACWTRARALDQALSESAWGKQSAKQFSQFVTHTLRLSRSDLSPLFTIGHGSDNRSDADLLRAAVRIADDRTNRRLARWLVEGRAPARWEDGMKGSRRKQTKSAPAPTHSEWSQFGLLRTDWSGTSARLAIGYSGRELMLEASVGRQVLWSGACRPEVRVDGKLLSPTSDWEELCWVSDYDGDYLEVAAHFGEHLIVQRQMYLARADKFLVLADAILLERPAKIDYRLRLPLGRDMTFQPADETREGWLSSGKPCAAVLPLALPEWRADPRVGRLELVEGHLTLEQSAAAAQGMFAPLFFDLDRQRLSKRLTWRQLAVAENRQNQPTDVATGYRVQIGREQWLVYRSLTPAVGRTLLGHHLLTEYLVGRFTRKGEVEKLVEIE